ncbi:MAG: hypothetical protein R3Y33_04745 [Clostridia bacterium]
MNEILAWEMFCKTGKIEDYLSYKNTQNYEMTNNYDYNNKRTGDKRTSSWRE